MSLRRRAGARALRSFPLPLAPAPDLLRTLRALRLPLQVVFLPDKGPDKGPNSNMGMLQHMTARNDPSAPEPVVAPPKQASTAAGAGRGGRGQLAGWLTGWQEVKERAVGMVTGWLAGCGG